MATLGQQIRQGQGASRPLDRLWVLWERNTGPESREYHSLMVKDMATEEALTVAETMGAESLAAAERAAGQTAPWRVPPVIVQAPPTEGMIPRDQAQQMLARAIGHVQVAREQAAESQAEVEKSQEQIRLLVAAVQMLQEKLHVAEEEVAAANAVENPMKKLKKIYFTTDNVPTPDLPSGVLEVDFRRDLKSGIASRLRDAGFELMTVDEWKDDPTRPTLSIALTPGNLQIRCPIPFEVAVRVTVNEYQVVGKETKRTVQVWSKTGGPTDEFPDQELESILSLVDAFVVDYKTALEEPDEPVEAVAATPDAPLEALLEQALQDQLLNAGPVPVNLMGENGDEEPEAAAEPSTNGAAANAEVEAPIVTEDINNQSLIGRTPGISLQQMSKPPADAGKAGAAGAVIRQ